MMIPGANSILRRGYLLLLLAFTLFFPATAILAQTTLATGSITGTTLDPSGAVVSGAHVTIASTSTGHTAELVTNGSGSYTTGALPPGTYRVTVTAPGFTRVVETVTVQVGNTTTANFKLTLGASTQTVEVQGSAVSVNTQQAEVQGVLTSKQIENLPVNGRNFLDLAQLEPGVQIQDGQNFDPTKAGYSSISFGGRFGRTARINVDGVDVSDETVGTTTQNIPASAIDEFQLAQSSLDMSNDVTSSGAINVTTKSGSNAYHGELFELFRDRRAGGAAAPGGLDLPFQRSQFGGNVGGWLIRDKLFFFADAERIKQDSSSPVNFAAPFSSLSGSFNVPFRDTELDGRLDYNLGSGKLFYRFNYFANSLPSDFGLGYSVYKNKDYTRQHVVGYDFTTGSFLHSLRFSYLKFQNQIVDTVVGSNLPFASLGATLATQSGAFYTGPSPLAPQSTPQQNIEAKYDGSKQWGAHLVRYGLTYNHIQGGGFANFYGTAPRISWTTNTASEIFATNGPFPALRANDPDCQGLIGMAGVGDPSKCDNPLNYPAQNLRVGNGLGYNTLNPALGFPAGGLGPDNRLGIYLGDVWKVKPNLTLTIALRYDRDTGRTDSDLPAIPELNAVFPGQGDRVNQPNLNFAPQFGFAWDPSKSGKTSIRGGVGLYYENIIYNNVLFDRPFRLQTGAFNQVSSACVAGQPQPVPTNNGFITPGPGVCTNTDGTYKAVGDAAAGMVNFWRSYTAANPLDLKAPNPNYIGSYLAGGFGVPQGFFDPRFKTPRSVQINIGFQRELHPGLVVTADYLRNVQTHSLLGIDINHVGDVSNFSLSAAQAAIARTNAAFNATSVDGAISNGATMDDYASNGLTADSDFGQACSQAIGAPCAFGGRNSTQAQSIFLKPIGRSVYNALQVKLVGNASTSLRGLKALNFQVAYSLSRLQNSGGAQTTGTAGDNDQDFVIGAADYNKPNRYFGDSLLDRRHQVSFGGYGDLPYRFRLGMIAHFYSPLSSAIVIPNNSLGNGEIFRSDFTGDGTTQDPMPGTKLGAFDRAYNARTLGGLINAYNNNYGNQPTPAGQLLVENNLMTLTQLQATVTKKDGTKAPFGGVAPTISAPPSDQQNFPWLRAFDANVQWSYRALERFSITPSVGVFNLFNFANFDLPPATMSGIVSGTPGAINGTGKADQNQALRVGNGTGVYGLGAARQVEFGLRVDF